MLYAIRLYENGIATGYFIGPRGAVYGSKKDMEREAAKLNATDQSGAVYRAEPIRD